jgi:hypothetical protein
MKPITENLVLAFTILFGIFVINGIIQRVKPSEGMTGGAGANIIESSGTIQSTQTYPF